MSRINCLFLLVLIGCREPQEVETNPYYPNIGITVKELRKSGWSLTTAEDGVCVYAKEGRGPKLVFYLDMQEDCKIVRAQELYIGLNYWQQNKPEQERVTLEVTEEIISKIDSVLSVYNSRQTSGFRRVTPCRLAFIAENRKNKRVEWDILNCSDEITLKVYTKLN